MKSVLLAAVIFFAFNLKAMAFENLRTCMLLPIIEEGKVEKGFEVYSIVENELKKNIWCQHRSNSQVIEILKDYRKNLKEHLKTSDVLSVIAAKSKAGSLFRLTMADMPQGTRLSLEVVGDNGKEIYFSEKTVLNTKDSHTISQQVINWLEVYEKTIPYHGLVKGVLGNQITVDIGNRSYFTNESEIEIIRIIEKNKHPLLKEIIDYKSEKIADGKIYDLNDKQAQAKIYSYQNESKIKANDWVIVKKKNVSFGDRLIEESTDNQTGTLGRNGQVSFLGRLSTSSLDQNLNGSRSADAMILGIDLNAELWATRNYFGNINLVKNFGVYDFDRYAPEDGRHSTKNTNLRIFGGYRYLPVGFFYGPQFDVYLGYAKYEYDIRTSALAYLTKYDFSGILLGAKANIPLERNTRIYLAFDFLMFNDFDEKNKMLGTEKSVSSYRLECGAVFNYAARMSYLAGIEVLNNSAEFSGDVKEIKFNDITAKLGIVFTF